MDKQSEKTLILIADDNSRNLQVLAGMLQELDCNISIATNGKQVLQIAEDVIPDLILLDVMMPEMDGFETCRILQLHPKTKDIPIIFLTARVEVEDVVKGFSLGAVDYVAKPFNSAELLARVKTHLYLRKIQKENIALEQKNSILAMIVTANHELSQPLTGAIANFDYFKLLISEKEMTPDQNECIAKIESSLNEIKEILTKFRKAQSFSFKKYISNVRMVSFDEEVNKRVSEIED